MAEIRILVKTILRIKAKTNKKEKKEEVIWEIYQQCWKVKNKVLI